MLDMAAIYSVDVDMADDPEATTHDLMTVREICALWPDFAPLIQGDGTESLVYVREQCRIRIEPTYDTEDFEETTG